MVTIEKAAFHHSLKDEAVLQDINCSFKRERVGVFGAVGSGKSSFLMAILGELYATQVIRPYVYLFYFILFCREM